MAKRNEKNGLAWYGFSVFEPYPELVHGVLTRFGGVCGPEGALHLVFNDVAPHSEVRENLRRVEDALGLPPLAFVSQTHSANVCLVRPEDGYHPRGPEDIRPDFDAMVAPRPGVGLLIRLGDCQGIILYDPQSRVLGLAHSGWRGSVQNILGATVEAMVAAGAEAGEIRAGISPSLGPCCAEFKNYRQELPREFEEFKVGENHFDFWAISRKQLTDKGLKPENIEAAGICTKCSPEFFSYRRGDQGRFGLAASVTPTGR